MSYTHACLKCRIQYEDVDPDPYYCATCKAEKVALAKEIDERRAKLPPKPPKSSYQIAKEKGQMRGDGLYVRAGDLGIRF